MYDPLIQTSAGENQPYPTSYWADVSGTPPKNNGQLSEDLDSDVVIIGAGYTGLSCALHLAKEHNMEICIFGKSYKPGVPYTDGSYSLLVGHYCDQVKYIEDGDITKPHIILLAHSPSHTYKYTGRPVDTNMQNIPAGSVVVDPWRSFAKTDKYKVVHYGNSRVE